MGGKRKTSTRMAANISFIWSSSSPPPWFFGPWPTQCRVSKQLGFYEVETSAAHPITSLYSQNTTLCPAPLFVRHLALFGTSLCSAPLFVRHLSLSGTSLCPASRSNLICSYLTIRSKDSAVGGPKESNTYASCHKIPEFNDRRNRYPPNVAPIHG